MADKLRGIVGFKGITLAPVKTDTATAYVSEDAEPIPYAGQMSATPVSSTQDIYADDKLYKHLEEITGYTVEIRLRQMTLADMGKYGLGTYDETTDSLQASFSAKGETFSFRYIGDTVDKAPYYFNYRIFELSNIRYDNFQTKGQSAAVNDVIITGTFKSPQCTSVSDFAIMALKDDGSNQAACDTFMSDGETLPKVTP